MMYKVLFGLVFALQLFAFGNSVTWQEYCAKDKTNPPCATKCKLDSRCDENVFTPLTEEERKYVVQLHNEYRNKVALGKEPTLPPCQGGIQVISYDMEIEYLASCTAKQCVFSHDDARTLSGEPVGQNLFMNMPITNNMAVIKGGVSSWYNEVNLLQGRGPQVVASYHSGIASGTGHLTQVVWGDTKRIGCAIMRYTGQIGKANQLTCDYYPAGNVQTMPVYVNGTCQPNSKYPGLCGSDTGNTHGNANKAPRTMIASFIHLIVTMLLIPNFL